MPPSLLACDADLLRRVPHLGSFFPDFALTDAATAPAGTPRLRFDGDITAAGDVVAGIGPWRTPLFGARSAPVALVVAIAAQAGEGAIAAALRDPSDPADPAPARALIKRLRTERLGGAAGLPDPGAAGLGHAAGSAVLVLDPCDPARAGAAAALLARARMRGCGRPVHVARCPGATGAATLPHDLAAPLAPWTLLDLAAELHTLGDAIGLLARAAGVALIDPTAPPWAGPPAAAVFTALLRATRAACPFGGGPTGLDAALDLLGLWRDAAATNRGIVAATGIEVFKATRIRAALAGPDGPPRLHLRGSAAIAAAARVGGAAVVWAAVMPPGLPARAAAAGVKLVRLEDGFIRSAGLGVLLAPAMSLVLDPDGIHYDARTPSRLETILATAAFDPALRARAARLRDMLNAAGVTKYNLTGAIARIEPPAGRPAILVVGQAEDDAALRRSGAAIRTNLALLEAARAARPDAFIVYKPHPDVVAGMRRGRIPPAALARLADQVVADAPIAGLYAQVTALHAISSLAGFEALLRGLPVVVWGRPFYAGWGLTDDRDPPPRRGRALDLDALVAAALILYPRYLDPVTGLPCPVEIVLRRLAEPAPPRPAAWAPAALRALVGRVSRAWAEWCADH